MRLIAVMNITSFIKIAHSPCEFCKNALTAVTVISIMHFILNKLNIYFNSVYLFT